MLTLERLASLMQSNVHRVDGEFPLDVTYYDGANFDEGIEVYYRDADGVTHNVWIDNIARVGNDGVIYSKDCNGETIEVEIFTRVTQFDLMVNGAGN